MAIQGINESDPMKQGIIENTKKYTDSVTTDEKKVDQIEKIREDSKGTKIDTTA